MSMRLLCKRLLFVLMVAIGGSYVLLRTVLPILSLFHVDIEINDNAVVFLYFANRAAFWIALAAAFMIWRKGITRRYLRGNQAQLENICQQLSAMPIRYLGTTLPRKFREQALQIGPLYFVPEENAPADCAARAAEITEPLFAALMESEKKRFSDYSQPPEVKLCFRKLGESVWRVKVSTAWLNGRASLYYSPFGRTRALKERAWWPPIALSPVWFV